MRFVPERVMCLSATVCAWQDPWNSNINDPRLLLLFRSEFESRELVRNKRSSDLLAELTSRNRAY